MSQEMSYEEQKRARRKLRGQQRGLRHGFLRDIQRLSDHQSWETLNGDQIQRLFESPAELFVIQFNGNIDERVVAEARQKVLFLRSQGHATACCAIVDGLDTARLLAAYLGTSAREPLS